MHCGDGDGDRLIAITASNKTYITLFHRRLSLRGIDSMSNVVDSERRQEGRNGRWVVTAGPSSNGVVVHVTGRGSSDPPLAAVLAPAAMQGTSEATATTRLSQRSSCSIRLGG